MYGSTDNHTALAKISANKREIYACVCIRMQCSKQYSVTDHTDLRTSAYVLAKF